VAVSRKKDDCQLLLLLPLFFKRSLEKDVDANSAYIDKALSIFKVRNPKFEYRNKFKTRIAKVQNVFWSLWAGVTGLASEG
jgi:hypothetical protein